MEAAGLAVGIVPLVIEAIKSYNTARKLFKTYRRCSEEIDKLFFQFEIRRTNFENECDLLLDSCSLTHDPDGNTGANEHASGSEGNQRLEQNYKNCAGILECIVGALNEVLQEMQCFKILKKERLTKDEPLKNTFRRLCMRTAFPFRKPEVDKQLRSLKDLNGELQQIRSYVDEFHSRRQRHAHDLPVPQKPPHQYAMVRQAAGTLHRALIGSWGCDMTSHSNHEARLCLAAEPESGERVSLDLAISFQDVSDTSGMSVSLSEEPLRYYRADISSEVPYWLQIQSSIPTKKPPNPPPLAQESVRIAQTLLSMQLDNVLRTGTKRSRDSSHDAIAMTRPSTQRALLHHGNSCRSITATYATAAPKTNLPPPPLQDLSQANHICRLINETLCNPTLQSTAHPHCLGYLKAGQDYQHLFYCTSTTAPKPGQPAAKPMHAKSSSMAQVLTSIPHHEVRPDQQLNIAHRLAVALLRYNGTPWLADSWRTEDVFVLGDAPDLSATTLSTMHFKTTMPDRMVVGDSVTASTHTAAAHEISPNRAAAPYQTPARPPSAAVQAETAASSGSTTTSPSANQATDDTLAHRYGIRNVPLFSLGVALLEINQQQPLAFQPGEDQIVQVRKMADRPMRLGPAYKAIVKRCLACDFGEEGDLDRAELQGAVHRKVVCELEELMGKLAVK